MIDRHFTATGLVFSRQGQILLIHHKKLNVWLPPGGHVEKNERPDDAVLREIFEETGIRAALLKSNSLPDAQDDFAQVLATPFAVFDEDIRAQHNHFHLDLLYLCRALDEVLQENRSETNGAAWFGRAQIDGLETYHNAKSIIQHAFDYFEKNPSDFFGK